MATMGWQLEGNSVFLCSLYFLIHCSIFTQWCLVHTRTPNARSSSDSSTARDPPRSPTALRAPTAYLLHVSSTDTLASVLKSRSSVSVASCTGLKNRTRGVNDPQNPLHRARHRDRALLKTPVRLKSSALHYSNYL